MNERQQNKIEFANAVKKAKAYRTELLCKLSGLITIDTENTAKERIISHATIREINQQCQLLEQLIVSLSDEQ